MSRSSSASSLRTRCFAGTWSSNRKNDRRAAPDNRPIIARPIAIDPTATEPRLRQARNTPFFNSSRKLRLPASETRNARNWPVHHGPRLSLASAVPSAEQGPSDCRRVQLAVRKRVHRSFQGWKPAQSRGSKPSRDPVWVESPAKRELGPGHAEHDLPRRQFAAQLVKALEGGRIDPVDRARVDHDPLNRRPWTPRSRRAGGRRNSRR